MSFWVIFKFRSTAKIRLKMTLIRLLINWKDQVKFNQLTKKKKKSFDQMPNLTENFDQLKMSSEIWSSDHSPYFYYVLVVLYLTLAVAKSYSDLKASRIFFFLQSCLCFWLGWKKLLKHAENTITKNKLVVFAKLFLYESKKSCSCLFKYFETFFFIWKWTCWLCRLAGEVIWESWNFKCFAVR